MEPLDPMPTLDPLSETAREDATEPFEVEPAALAPIHTAFWRRSSARRWIAGAVAAAAVSLIGPHLGSADEPATRARAGRDQQHVEAGAPRATRGAERARGRHRALVGLELGSRRLEDDTYLVDAAQGDTAVLTLDASLQQHMEAYFARYQVPEAGLVAIEPSTGRVLAYVSHRGRDSAPADMARDASAPAASVFKVITGAALLDAGVPATQRVCYHGGESRLVASLLEPNPELDRTCATLSEAMGGSLNAVFARLADQRLDAPTLERYAHAFAFGQGLPFDLESTPSTIEVPTDRLEFARTSAGFWHSRMSPLHGALIAATIANDGAMPRAGIVDRVIDAEGHIAHRFEPSTYRQVIGRDTADALNTMMRLTVTRGTSRRAFHDDRGRPFLPGIAVAGKTGTLSEERPYRGYTWWVGFAPADHPTIAIATLVVNTPEWRIKASHAAVEALRHHLVTNAPRD
ncbi:MAG: penicillin-binding protein [Deltaproteobacteria bacterium]|nr:penicillin-binding protein [Deltaproteobacteria bacterium]